MRGRKRELRKGKNLKKRAKRELRRGRNLRNLQKGEERDLRRGRNLEEGGERVEEPEPKEDLLVYSRGTWSKRMTREAFAPSLPLPLSLSDEDSR